jgi:hypothetical protein
VIRDRIQDFGRSLAETRKVDARDAVLPRELRQDDVEDRPLGQQRVDEEKVRAAAALVEVDQGSRFFAGGKSRE